jgi:hypothetical protein
MPMSIPTLYRISPIVASVPCAFVDKYINMFSKVSLCQLHVARLDKAKERNGQDLKNPTVNNTKCANHIDQEPRTDASIIFLALT